MSTQRTCPMAWDADAERFTPPPEAEMWKVRRCLPRGGYKTILDGAQPLFLKITDGEDDLNTAIRAVGELKGRYRLDPVDAMGHACGASYAIVEADPAKAPPDE